MSSAIREEKTSVIVRGLLFSDKVSLVGRSPSYAAGGVLDSQKGVYHKVVDCRLS